MSRTATVASNAVGVLRLVPTMEAIVGIAPGVRSGYRQIRAGLRVRCCAGAARLKQLARRSAVLDALCNPVPAQLSLTQS